MNMPFHKPAKAARGTVTMDRTRLLAEASTGSFPGQRDARPRLSPATSTVPAQLVQKGSLRRSWIAAREWFQDWLAAASIQDLKPSSRLSVVLTPSGLLVHGWPSGRAILVSHHRAHPCQFSKVFVSSILFSFCC